MSNTFFSLILILLSIPSSSYYCPSNEWTPCAEHDQMCEIPSSINATTISYGAYNPDNKSLGAPGQWVFTQISNTRTKSFSIKCSNSNFGEIYDNGDAKLGCCYYRINNEYIIYESPSLNENNWKRLALNGQTFIINPIQYVKYGAFDENGGMYIYRWMQGEYKCEYQLFGDLTLFNNAQALCSYIPALNHTTSEFINCGNSKYNHTKCDMSVAGNIGSNESVRMVEFGKYPNYLYRLAYSTNNNSEITDSIPCNTNLFDNPNPNGGEQQCSVSNDTVFNGIVGLYLLGLSCSNCIINNKTIKYGITSTNIQSNTHQWKQSVSNIISSGFVFIESSNNLYSLTSEVSYNINKNINESYTVKLSNSCNVNCGNGTSNNWIVYQWIFQMGEFIGVDIKQFNIYSCYYICSLSSIPPKCPPTYCNNANCTECKDWP